MRGRWIRPPTTLTGPDTRKCPGDRPRDLKRGYPGVSPALTRRKKCSNAASRSRRASCGAHFVDWYIQGTPPDSTSNFLSAFSSRCRSMAVGTLGAKLFSTPASSASLRSFQASRFLARPQFHAHLAVPQARPRAAACSEDGRRVARRARIKELRPTERGDAGDNLTLDPSCCPVLIDH